MSNEQKNTPVDQHTLATKVLAVGRLTKKGENAAGRLPVMTGEITATVELYLAGKIEQWWLKSDESGVVFLFNLTDPKVVKQLLDVLPLGVAGMMEFDLIPLSPLTPLRFLMPETPVA